MEEKILFIDKLTAQLVRWEDEFDELKICVVEMSGDGKGELFERLAELRAKKEETKIKLAQLMESGDEAWGEARTGIEKNWGELKTAIAGAWSKLWDDERPNTAA